MMWRSTRTLRWWARGCSCGAARTWFAWSSGSEPQTYEVERKMKNAKCKMRNRDGRGARRFAFLTFHLSLCTFMFVAGCSAGGEKRGDVKLLPGLAGYVAEVAADVEAVPPE